jgi:Flp pilus assembly protein CpaB
MMATSGRSAGSGLVVGLLAGALVGGAVVQGVRAGARAQDAAAWAPVPVLVTARELPAGHRVTEADLVEASWPSTLVTESCATPTNLARFVGQTVRWRVAPDTVLRETDLVAAEPSCATRTRRVLERLDGGTPEVARLGQALLERHGGAP